MSELPYCPIHPGRMCLHNILTKSARERGPKAGHAYVYSITQVKTRLRYIGYTNRFLSTRWMEHCSCAKRSARFPDDPLYKAIRQDGRHMFIMEELEECGEYITLDRELDYMREFDSWNPEHGYNNPNHEADYARRLYFLFNPEEGIKYSAILDKRQAAVGGWRQPLPAGYEWLEKEDRELEEVSQREGRRLMSIIKSLATPVVTN